MGFRSLLQRGSHAAMVAPRLSMAALRAGVGPAGAAEVLLISQAALAAAARHGHSVPGRTNALRHFIWQALLTARHGAEAARRIAVAQEAGSPAHRDSAVDEHNNAAGRAWGEAHADALGRLSIRAAVEALVPVGLEKWDAGELVWVRTPRSPPRSVLSRSATQGAGVRPATR